MQGTQQRIRPSAYGLLGALALACAPALAQDAWGDGARPGSGLGLSATRMSVPIGCGASLLPCGGTSSSLALRQPGSLRWSVELAPAYIPATTPMAWSAAGRQALSLSVMGRQPLFGSSFSLYGRLGTAAAASSFGDGAATGDTSYGVAFGAGVSMDVTQRLSASFGVDSYDLRSRGASLGATSGMVRSTSLGLQYRY